MKILEDITKYKLYIFDSDGCLVEGGKPLKGAIDLINLLKKRDKQVVVFTNNSTSHPTDVVAKYKDIGLEIDQVINSGKLAGEFCRNEAIKSVYIVGELGLNKVLLEYDIEIRESEADAVIVGMDRTVTYDKLAKATRMIRSGARFIATNPDPSFPTPRGLEPGAGSMIAALEASTDRKPEIILGKPNSWGYNKILDMFQVKNSDAIMFGDRFETDILGARNAGIDAILVGTGISRSRNRNDELAKLDKEGYISNLSELVNTIQSSI